MLNQMMMKVDLIDESWEVRRAMGIAFDFYNVNYNATTQCYVPFIYYQIGFPPH